MNTDLTLDKARTLVREHEAVQEQWSLLQHGQKEKSMQKTLHPTTMTQRRRVTQKTYPTLEARPDSFREPGHNHHHYNRNNSQTSCHCMQIQYVLMGIIARDWALVHDSSEAISFGFLDIFKFTFSNALALAFEMQLPGSAPLPPEYIKTLIKLSQGQYVNA